MIKINTREDYEDFKKIKVCDVYGFRTDAAVYLVSEDLNGLVVLEDRCDVNLVGADLEDYTIGDVIKKYFNENETIEKIYKKSDDFTIDFTENK